MVSGPELARLVREFEDSDEDKHAQLPHHEQSHASLGKEQYAVFVSRARKL